MMEESLPDAVDKMTLEDGTCDKDEASKKPDSSSQETSSDDDSCSDSNDIPQPDSPDDDANAELLKQRKEQEELLSEEEKNELRDRAQQLKESGNASFKDQSYSEAVELYTEALSVCPLCFLKERSIMYSNRAAAYMHLDKTDLVIKDCTEAITLHAHYPKPLLRRAQTYEKTEKLDEAFEDYKKLLEIDSRNVEALLACQRLPKQIEERNEKLKTEMMGKLKDLGNLVLRPFGLSTDNFKLQQNESGGYSVNFSNS